VEYGVEYVKYGVEYVEHGWSTYVKRWRNQHALVQGKKKMRRR
jgi:hypothetical protein